VLALERREKFAKRHPEIDIRAQREGPRMVYYVKAPSSQVCWLDPFAMMDDLEAEYDALNATDNPDD
jgi:hypothetical protein